MGRLPALLLSGGCWIGVLATYNTTVQMLVPDWVKARSLALYQTAIFGGLAAGSFMWAISPARWACRARWPAPASCWA